MAPDATQLPKFALPSQIVSPADVSRLQRELEAVQDFLDQAAIRSPGTGLSLPQTSRLLDDFAGGNKLNLLQPSDLKQAREFINYLRSSAPVIRISFANDPSANFIGKITTWLRSNIHSLVLLRIGLEPALAAGCMVRVGSKQYDFSLRQHFAAQRETLVKLLDSNATEGTQKCAIPLSDMACSLLCGHTPRTGW